MGRKMSFADRRAGFMRWYRVRRCLRRPQPSKFVLDPEPLITGHLGRGQLLANGEVMFAAHAVQNAQDDIWSEPAPGASFEAERQGFQWLEDLAAVGDTHARARAQTWFKKWIDVYGKGRLPGWSPDYIGCRVIRLLNHADFLMRGLDEVQCGKVLHQIGAQVRYLAHCWADASSGLPRIEALAALVHGSLALEGLQALAGPAVERLIEECDAYIASDGSIPNRNPEELLNILTVLIWTSVALSESDPSKSGSAVPGGLVSAIQRIAPTLRSLRHSDGALARFHGGGSGIEGRLEHALAASGVTRASEAPLVMGYARFNAARVSIIVDAAPPPYGAGSEQAHASTLAFEMTSGRRPMVVSCGPGASFGEEWNLAARSTPSQSVLCLDGYSSARVDLDQSGRAPLADGPTRVPFEMRRVSDGQQFKGGHDGYVTSHGLTLARTMTLFTDGRRLNGEDLLIAAEREDRQRFDRLRKAMGDTGIPYDVRFHLHPDVAAQHEMDKNRIKLTLLSGEIWLFVHDKSAELTLENSVFLEKGRLTPRATKQIVLTGAAMQYSKKVKWSFLKTQATADVTRDFASDSADPYE